MFNIIKTPRNYFTLELLHNSNVTFHCSVSHCRPYWEVSCSEEVFYWPSTAPVLAVLLFVYVLMCWSLCVCACVCVCVCMLGSSVTQSGGERCRCSDAVCYT